MNKSNNYQGTTIDNRLYREGIENAHANLAKTAALSPVVNHTMPLVEHMAMVNNRLESIENGLEVVRNWIMGPYPDECDTACSSGEPNLESQIFRADRVAGRIEDLVNTIRNRIS